MNKHVEFFRGQWGHRGLGELLFKCSCQYSIEPALVDFLEAFAHWHDSSLEGDIQDSMYGQMISAGDTFIM